MVAAAAHALAAGTCTYIVGVRALYNPSDRRYSATDATHVAGPLQSRFHMASVPRRAIRALVAALHARLRGDARRAVRNCPQRATMHNEIRSRFGTVRPSSRSNSTYRRGSLRAHVLVRCGMPVSGAVAFVMTTADRAMHAPQAACLSSFAVNDARRLFEGAEILPRDVQVAQLYDGFSLMVWTGSSGSAFARRAKRTHSPKRPDFTKRTAPTQHLRRRPR